MGEEDLREALTAFATEKRFRGRGPLSVALVVTQHARTMGLPLDPARLVTEGGGLPLEQGGRGKLALAQWHASRVHEKLRCQTERRLFKMITDPPLYPLPPANPPL